MAAPAALSPFLGGDLAGADQAALSTLGSLMQALEQRVLLLQGMLALASSREQAVGAEHQTSVEHPEL